jgi:hypothetical protein
MTLGALEAVDMKKRLTERDNNPAILVHDRLLTSRASFGFRRRGEVWEDRTLGGARMTVRHGVGEIVRRRGDGGQHVEERRGETGKKGVVPRRGP